MEVSDIKKAPSEEYKGKVYYFCSEYCKKSFKKDPASYIKKNRRLLKIEDKNINAHTFQ